MKLVLNDELYSYHSSSLSDRLVGFIRRLLVPDENAELTS